MVGRILMLMRSVVAPEKGLLSQLPPCPGNLGRADPKLNHPSYWVAVKELKMSCRNSEILSFSTFHCSGNLN